jgi:glycosyltransferase involved in cell wall biosynthesis
LKKILRIATRFFPEVGGTENRILKTSLLLQDKYNFTIAALSSNKYPPQNYTIGKNIKVKRFRTLLKYGPLRISPRIFFECAFSKRKYDLIHLQGIYRFHLFCALFSDVNKIPFILTTHGMALDFEYMSKSKKIIKNIFDNEILINVLNHIDHVIVVNPLQEQYLVSKGLSRKKISFSPPAIDDIFLKKGNGLVFRKKYNIPLNSPVIGYVGSFNYQKNIKDLINIYVSLKKEFPNLILLLIGELNNYLYNLLDKIPSCYLKTVITPGLLYGEQLLNAYYSMNVFVHPSKNEGFPTVLIESYCSGIPSVAYSIPSIRILKHDLPNLHLSSVDENSLKEVTRGLLLEKTIIDNNGDLLKNQYWTWNRVALELEKIYKLYV